MSSPQSDEYQIRQPFQTQEASWHPAVKGAFQGLALRQGLPYRAASASLTRATSPSNTLSPPAFGAQNTWTLRGIKGIWSLPSLFFRRQLSVCNVHQQQSSRLVLPGFLYSGPLHAVELAWRSQLAFGPSFDVYMVRQMPLWWRNAAVAPSADDFQSAGDQSRPVKLMLSAGLAGAVSRTATAPLDRIKFLLIMGNPGMKEKYTIRQALHAMSSEGTYKAFFRGNGTNVIKNVPENAIKLTVNDRMQSLLLNDRALPITLGERLLIGSLAGGLAQVVIYPMEVIQTRLAATHGIYRGMLDCSRKIWRHEGMAGFTRGLVPTMLGILPYAGVDIAAFEIAKENLVEAYHGTPPGTSLLAAGLLSSTIAQIIAYPLGFVRTRLQMDGRGGQPRQYHGMMDCFGKVVQHEGLRGLYKGFGMNLAKVAPAASISWFVFEESKLYLHCHDVCHHR